MHRFTSGLSILSIDIYFCFCPSTILFDDCGFVPKVREPDFSSSIFLSQDCLGYLGSFVCLCKLFCPSSVENATGNLIGIALNL